MRSGDLRNLRTTASGQVRAIARLPSRRYWGSAQDSRHYRGVIISQLRSDRGDASGKRRTTGRPAMLRRHRYADQKNPPPHRAIAYPPGCEPLARLCSAQLGRQPLSEKLLLPNCCAFRAFSRAKTLIGAIALLTSHIPAFLAVIQGATAGPTFPCFFSRTTCHNPLILLAANCSCSSDLHATAPIQT